MWPARIPTRGASEWLNSHANVSYSSDNWQDGISELLSRIGGFSKWCLKLVWVWPFLSNHGCFGVACYLRNALHRQCMPHSDGHNYILTTDVVVNTNACIQCCVLRATVAVITKTTVFWSGTNLFLTECCTASVSYLINIINTVCPKGGITSYLHM